MKALTPRVKIFGFVAALLAGVVLVSVDEAGARSMGGNAGIGKGRPPSFTNTTHSMNPSHGTSKPGKSSVKADKSYSHDHGKGHKDRKAEREERKAEREERKAERKGNCITTGGCRVDVGKPSPGKPAPTVEVRDHRTSSIGASVNSRDHRGNPPLKLTPSDLQKLNPPILFPHF